MFLTCKETFWKPYIYKCVCVSGSFTTDSMMICLYEQNVYSIEQNKVQVRTFQVGVCRKGEIKSGLSVYNDSKTHKQDGRTGRVKHFCIINY